MRTFTVVKILVSIVLAVYLWPLTSSGQTTEYDFALYNSEKASWQPEVEALRGFLTATGHSFEEVDARMLQSGALQAGRHRALLMPGGLVGKLSYELAATGVENIREFIRAGGGYVGICAGAALAACRFEVALETAPNKATHSANDYVNFLYPNLLELWPGEARSPYEWAPFLRGGRVEGVQISGHAPLAEGHATRTRMFYLAGPMLPMENWTPDLLPTGLEVWGKIEPPHDAKVDPRNLAAIVKFQHGLGRVVLFAHHPIIPVQGDGPVDVSGIPDRLESVMSHTQDASKNWQNWNLLNAAFLTVTNRPVAKLNPHVTLKRLRQEWSRRCELSFLPSF